MIRRKFFFADSNFRVLHRLWQLIDTAMQGPTSDWRERNALAIIFMI